MAVDCMIVIVVVDTYIEPFSGLMVGWVTPASVLNITWRCSAHQFVLKVVVDAIVTTIATGSPDSARVDCSLPTCAIVVDDS